MLYFARKKEIILKQCYLVLNYLYFISFLTRIIHKFYELFSQPGKCKGSVNTERQNFLRWG